MPCDRNALQLCLGESYSLGASNPLLVSGHSHSTTFGESLRGYWHYFLLRKYFVLPVPGPSSGPPRSRGGHLPNKDRKLVDLPEEAELVHSRVIGRKVGDDNCSRNASSSIR